MRKNILSELESRHSFMKPAERRIAEAVFADPKGFTSCSLGSFADAVGVSQGSVVNFSRRYAGGGFPILKLRVAEALANEASVPPTVGKSSEMKKTLETMLEGATRAMRNTAAVNSDETLTRVADMILAARRVELCGLFRSAVVATDFCYHLIQIGIPATYISDTLTSLASASILTKDSLLIAISLSGETKDVIEACRAAKENGVPVVAITCNRESPLARLADELLISAVSGGLGYFGENSEARLSQMLLVDTVCAYLGERLEGGNPEKQSRLRGILDSHGIFEK